MKSALLLAALWASLAAPAAAPAPVPAPAIVQNYKPRPALWLLADADTKIYLFGTVHLLPPGFKWRSAALDRAVAESAELVVEDYQAPGEEAAAMKAMSAYMLLPSPSPILDRVPEDKRAALRQAIEASALEMKYFDQLRTWAAGMLLGLAQLLGSYGVEDADDAPGVEDVLEATFEAARKPISSIEDGDAVIRALSSIPEEVQVQLLVEAVEASPTAVQDSTEDDHQWARGNFEALGADLRRDLPPAVFDVLLTKRNAAWTNWLGERLKRPGTLLVAVGAGHLAGDVSVQRMLARRGLEVKRIG